MTRLPLELRELIETGALAHLSTIDPDGSPQVTVIWLGLDGDQLVSGHLIATGRCRTSNRTPGWSCPLSTPARTEPSTTLCSAARPRGGRPERRSVGSAQPAGIGLPSLQHRVPGSQKARLCRAVHRRTHRWYRTLGAERLKAFSGSTIQSDLSDGICYAADGARRRSRLRAVLARARIFEFSLRVIQIRPSGSGAMSATGINAISSR
jgi:hypothetical protein